MSYNRIMKRSVIKGFSGRNNIKKYGGNLQSGNKVYGVDAYAGVNTQTLKTPTPFERERFDEYYKKLKGWRPKYPTYKKGVDNKFLNHHNPVNMNVGVQEQFTKKYVALREKYYNPKLDHVLSGDEMPMRQISVPTRYNNMDIESKDVNSLYGMQGPYCRIKENKWRLDVMTGEKFRSGRNVSVPYKTHKYIYPYIKKGFNSTRDFSKSFGERKFFQGRRDTPFMKWSDSKVNPFRKEGFTPKPGDYNASSVNKVVTGKIKPWHRNPFIESKGHGFMSEQSHRPNVCKNVVGNDKNLFTRNDISYKPTKYFPHPNMNTQKFISPYSGLEKKDHHKKADLYKVTSRPFPGEMRKNQMILNVSPNKRTTKIRNLNYLPGALERNVHINNIYNIRYRPRIDMKLPNV